MHRRAVALAVPATAIALTVSSCGSIPEDWRTPAFLRMGEDEVDERLPAVSGEVGEKPEVTFPDMEPPDEEVSGVVHEGPGEEGLVRDDDLVVANFAQYEWSGPGEGEELDPDQASYETGAPTSSAWRRCRTSWPHRCSASPWAAASSTSCPR